jgi:hypothetical protein
MTVVPISLEEANDYVDQWHRHHQPVVGHKFSVAVECDSEIVGVAIVGRPVSRVRDDGWTLEVLRCCTDGTSNACSMLYRTCWRAAQAMGYRKLISYTLASEAGGSLRGAGFKLVGQNRGGSWSCPSRPRVNKHPLEQKQIWELTI